MRPWREPRLGRVFDAPPGRPKSIVVLATGLVATNCSYPLHPGKSSVRKSVSARCSAFWGENGDGESHAQDNGSRTHDGATPGEM
jgi:hypothetical protein